jgi:hypothetical protein
LLYRVARKIPSILRKLSILIAALFAMQSVSCSSNCDIDVVDRNHHIASADSCTQEEIDRGGHYTTCGSKNSKLNHEKQSSDENGASKGTTRYDPESEDSCYSTEKKSTHHEENAYSSFPGSPRNKSAREIFTSLVPEDYDYSRSTEYAHSVHTAAASAAADKNTYESRILANGDSCAMSSAAKGKQVPLQQDHFQVMPVSDIPDTKPKNGVMPQSPIGVASVTPLYVGKYAKQRKELDHSYHSHYTPERQFFHDMLIGTYIVRALYGEKIKNKN